jgi:hypothetical protein
MCSCSGYHGSTKRNLPCSDVWGAVSVDLERQKRTRSCGCGESGEGPGNGGTAVGNGSTKLPVVPQVPVRLQQEAKQPVSEKVEKRKKPRTYPWNGLSPSEDLAWVDPKEYEPSTLLSPSILHASAAYTCRSLEEASHTMRRCWIGLNRA